MSMTYSQACQEIRRIGHGNVEGEASLASTCQALARVHAISAEMLFDGAKRMGIKSGRELIKYIKNHSRDWGFLQF